MFDLTSIIAILGLALACLSLLWQWFKERNRKPKLKLSLKKTIHGQVSKEDQTTTISLDVMITNEGERPTSISAVRFEFCPVKSDKMTSVQTTLEEPIKINGDDVKRFKNEINVKSNIPKEDCIFSLEFTYTKGSVKSNKVPSKYYKILPTPSTQFKKPKS